MASGEVVGVSADDTTAVVTAAGLGSGPAANVIVAYDLADGRQRWQLDVPVWDHLAGPALTSDGVTVYTGGSIRRDQSSTSGMVAESVSTVYDTLTGSELWNTHDNGRPHPGPRVGDGNVYESTDDALVVLDARSGRERWRRSTTDPGVLASGNGVVLIAPSGPADASDSEMLAADTGKVRWHGTLGGTAADEWRHDLRRQRRCGRTLRGGLNVMSCRTLGFDDGDRGGEIGRQHLGTLGVAMGRRRLNGWPGLTLGHGRNGGCAMGMFQATGVVTINGRPAANVAVSFAVARLSVARGAPAGAGPVAHGQGSDVSSRPVFWTP